MTELTNEQIWEVRFNASIERFGSFDECMEIPGYGLEPEPEEKKLTELQQSFKLRFEACKQRYRGMEEHMDIPDMDLWLSLKNEIIPKRPKLERSVCQRYYKVGDEFYTIEDLDEMELKKLNLFDVNDDAGAGAGDNDYDDDYYYDSDNYSRDSEYRLERKQDKFFCGKSGRNADKLEDRYN